MQLDEENDTKDEINENENNIDETEQIKNDNKKVRLFSAKDFRKQINKGDKLTALKQFLNALNTSKKHDYIFEYLESGGSCLELLHILELDSAIPPSLVFELVTHLLLKISINYPQYQSASYESCRYILNNYIAVINKMINLSSTSQERKACLKLLTAMVTFSSNLAKDILLQVNFHSTNIELLTKSTGEKDSVRDYFIHFLTAFLVDGNYPTLSTLLEKKGFIKSIIAGLQFDSADTVCVVISGMKNHILENPLVSKTAKMKVFNTQVVRDIVNLYNWKGPAALRAQKKNKSTAVVVDEYSKSKVSECVHDFLLVLCTSHRYGVIFKDHLLGLGKKNQNALMYTVLESLERPWEHSYACELVTKICGACPDLAKTMWNNLKTFLEPRMTPKWLNALKFAKILLKELQPACIEFCVKELGVYQLAQVIQFLVAPLPILKIVIPDNHTFEQPSIKKQVMSLLLQILTSLEVYVSATKGWLSLDNHRKLKTHITNHVARNFPDAKTIIDDWEHTDEPEVDKDTILTQSKFLEVVFDIFELYKKLAPQLLDTLSSKDLGITEFLEQIDNVCTGEDLEKLKIKIISIFIDVDQSQFSPKTDAFSVIFPLLLQFYCSTKDPSAFSCLRKLLKNTGIFDGCFYEINIWLNGILDLKNFDETVAQNLVEPLKMTHANALEYTEEFSKFKSRKNVDNNVSEIIENLLNDVVTENKITVKHRHLSPMTIGYLKHLSLSTVTKSDKVYSNFVFLHLFHCQTDDLTQDFFQSYDALPKNVKEYFLCWTDKQEIAIVKKSKGKFDIFHNFSKEFLTGNLDDFMPNCDLTLYDDLPLNLLQMSIFYISNLVNNATITKTRKNLFQDDYAETILGHLVLLNNVSFISLSKEKPKSLCTRFLLNVINQLINSGFNIESYLRLYRERLLTDTVRILKKPGKYNELHNFIAILEMFGFSYEQCLKVLSTLQDATTDLNEHVPIIYDVLTYCLERLSHLCESDANLKPLSSERVQRLTTYYLILTEKQEININKMTVAFHSYFKIFPHNIKDINNKLFQSILNRTEYSKENVGFALFLLDKNLQFFASIKDDLDNICNKKGVILPLIALLVDKNYDEQVLIDIFFKFEAPLAKALQKPQKAGQHFHQNYKGLVELITRYMAIEKCESILEKVQKFEVAETFHAKLLEAVCKKAINSDTNNVKVIRNAILTFVHLQMTLFKRKTKSEDDPLNMDDIALSFNNLLSEIYEKRHDQDLKTISENETLKLYVKFCLKFGVSGQPILLRIVRNLVDILASCMKKEDGRLILDMLLSHSEFFGQHAGRA
ncbi:hypothetical protein NQ318_022446 [Aromia moschata]|uniref:URB1 N-terminal domain-containing protein n=1 Tax=Aromia moschata TaxID=1265417 RepID=A0AAV8Z554_9CUCU|nr:hypothetical protein NQ318_022446 [Aromia moschata]